MALHRQRSQIESKSHREANRVATLKTADRLQSLRLNLNILTAQNHCTPRKLVTKYL